MLKEVIKLNILVLNFYFVCIDFFCLFCLGVVFVFNFSFYSGIVDENVFMDIIVSGIILLVLDIDGDNIMYLIISLVGLFKLSVDGFSVLINGLVIDFEL